MEAQNASEKDGRKRCWLWSKGHSDFGYIRHSFELYVELIEEREMRLDSKSARRIATGILSAQDNEIKDAIKCLENRPKQGLAKKGKPGQRRLETDIASVFGESLIGGGWSSRTYHYFIFEIEKSPDGKPLQLVVKGWSLNTRSNSERVRPVAIITMHAMERLMERRRDTALIQLAGIEFDMGFIRKMVFGENGSPLVAKVEFEVKTTHGRACGIVSESGVPVIRTWIHETGNRGQ